MNKRDWFFLVLLAVGCGGKSHSDSGSSSGAGDTGAGAGNASAGNADAGNAGSCPNNLQDSTPSEGAACPTPGLNCSGYGTLSCPLTAVCSQDSKWHINCPSMRFGPCTCPHQDSDRAPNEHRATASGCSYTRAASTSTANGANGANGECSQDSDCTNSELGDNGRCVQLGPIPGYACSYDTCFTDSACTKGSVCQCREPSDSIDANYCTKPSACRVDGDCGDGGYCSPSQAHEWCGTFYACHTPNDECVNDSDCGADAHCDFDANAKHWVCGDLCGAVPP